MNDNLDEYDFAPSSSSHLASLFDSSANLDTSSLIYIAPKQPKNVNTEAKTETPKPESRVVCACVVQVWKLINKKYIAIGKHGLAVIESAAHNSYEIILYKEKRNIIVRIKICTNFEVWIKKDNFASFYDSFKENWLIKFNNAEDSKTVVGHITKCGGKISSEKTEETALNINLIKPTDDVSQNTKQPDLKAPVDLFEDVSNFENRAKADILSRIAKMGQSILPNKTLEVDMADSEDDNKSTFSTISSRSTLPENSIISPPVTTTNIVQIPTHSQNFRNIPSTVFMSQPVTYDPMNMYIAENRAHNSEVRINLTQISEKLNRVLKLVDVDRPLAENNDTLKSKLKVLDLKVENLSREIKGYQEENKILKLKIVQHQEMVTSDKQSPMEEKRIHDEETSKKFEEELSSYKSTINNLYGIIDKQKTEIDELKRQLESNENDATIKNEMANLNDVISELRNKLSNYEQEAIKKLNEQVINEKVVKFNMYLKELMNGLFSNIIDNFNEEKDYKSSEIKSIIARNIKSTTMRIIQNFQQMFDVQ